MTMEYRTRLLNDERIVDVDIRGDFDSDRLVATIGKIAAGFPTGTTKNWIFRFDKTPLNINFPQAWDLVLMLKQLPCFAQPVLVALISPGDLSFGVSRMLEALSNSLPCQIKSFRTFDEAIQWMEADIES